MAIEVMPEWLASLDEEDVSFIKKFVLASGSLKEVAGIYGVTYPTVRLRLDRLIQKIRLGEQADEEPYIALIKRLAVKDKLDFDTAKLPFKLTVLTISRLLGEAIRRIHENKSVNLLFKSPSNH